MLATGSTQWSSMLPAARVIPVQLGPGANRVLTYPLIDADRDRQGKTLGLAFLTLRLTCPDAGFPAINRRSFRTDVGFQGGIRHRRRGEERKKIPALDEPASESVKDNRCEKRNNSNASYQTASLAARCEAVAWRSVKFARQVNPA
jgi:hypothetical protein